jgi:hypothetical protein
VGPQKLLWLPEPPLPELALAHSSELVLATGSRLVRPRCAGSEHLFDIDTLSTAAVFDHHILPDMRPVTVCHQKAPDAITPPISDASLDGRLQHASHEIRGQIYVR